MSIERLLKVATPAEAVTVAVPPSVPPLGFVPIAITMEAVLPVPVVTTLLLASRTCAVTAGLIEAPAAVFVGCWPKARWVAAPGVMLNVVLVAELSPLPVADKV